MEFVILEGKYYLVPEPWKGNHSAGDAKPGHFAKIPTDYTWEGSSLYISRKTRDAFVCMANEAKNHEINLTVHSGYRSAAYQKKMFSKLMSDGRTWDDLIRYIAPPGYSEHMLGTVVDLFPSNWRFASTPEYQWLKDNAATFGFVESYPESGREGYPWEAWHWKYIGDTMETCPKQASNNLEL